jgi:Flp pilus assembly pilin Flp
MFTKLAKRFWNDEQGLELSEYAVMAAVVILVAVGAVILLGGKIDTVFNALQNSINVPT